MNKLDLTGKTIAEVATILGTDYSFRVMSRDGVPCVGDCQFREDRYNLHLVEGKVVKWTVG